jgi:hypothetical protein
LQYFFATDFTQTDKKIENHDSKLKGDKLEGSMTYRLFPIAKNKILVRFENLADKLDEGEMNNAPQFLDVNKFAKDIYMEVNNQKASSIHI